jgi:Spy/CpxP family protein refolding chaperone
MKRFFKSLGIVAVAVAALGVGIAGAGLAAAQPGTHAGMPPGGPHGRGFGPGMHMGHMGPGMAGGLDEHFDRLADALDLTAEQRASFTSLRAQLKATVEPLIAEKHAAMQQLHDGVEAGSTDACALGALVVKAHGNDAALRQAHDQFQAGFTALLTPEQKSKYDAVESFGPRGPRGPWGPHEDAPEGE